MGEKIVFIMYEKHRVEIGQYRSTERVDTYEESNQMHLFRDLTPEWHAPGDVRELPPDVVSKSATTDDRSIGA